MNLAASGTHGPAGPGCCTPATAGAWANRIGAKRFGCFASRCFRSSRLFLEAMLSTKCYRGRYPLRVCVPNPMVDLTTVLFSGGPPRLPQRLRPAAEGSRQPPCHVGAAAPDQGEAPPPPADDFASRCGRSACLTRSCDNPSAPRHAGGPLKLLAVGCAPARSTRVWARAGPLRIWRSAPGACVRAGGGAGTSRWGASRSACAPRSVRMRSTPPPLSGLLR